MHKPEGWDQGQNSIQDLGIIQKDFAWVLQDDSCLDALHVLFSKKVHATAIVNKQASGTEVGD